VWPFVGALATAVMFVGSIFTPWAAVWGWAPVAIALTAWFWPKPRDTGPSVALERTP
jgi:cytochrome c oxidase subunit I+III